MAQLRVWAFLGAHFALMIGFIFLFWRGKELQYIQPSLNPLDLLSNVVAIDTRLAFEQSPAYCLFIKHVVHTHTGRHHCHGVSTACTRRTGCHSSPLRKAQDSASWGG